MNLNPTNWIAALLVSFLPAIGATNADKPAVVLLHGIHDSGAKMKWLAHQFERSGYETFCPSLTPANGRSSLEELAKQLNTVVNERFGAARPLHVVGFSMGGLISRCWVAQHPERVVTFATLSAPHNGTLFAYVNTLPGVRQMRPRSLFLTELARKDDAFASLHPLSLFTPLDLIIVPATSSRWKVAKNEASWQLFHPLMVFSPAIFRRLLQNMQTGENPTL
ncbi:MAG TPA: alpha/beta fold hydrolase [Chthoniobacterales bacterium]|jgi:triacylglycerol lipase